MAWRDAHVGIAYESGRRLSVKVSPDAGICPDLVSELAVAARELAPHLVTAYLKEVAAEFHSYYNAERFLVEDPVTQRARLALAAAAGQAIRNGLAVLGISAPEKM